MLQNELLITKPYLVISVTQQKMIVSVQISSRALGQNAIEIISIASVLMQKP